MLAYGWAPAQLNTVRVVWTPLVTILSSSEAKSTAGFSSSGPSATTPTKFAGTFFGRLAASAWAGASSAAARASVVRMRSLMSARAPVRAPALRTAPFEPQRDLAERLERRLRRDLAALQLEQAGPVERVEVVAVVREPRVPVDALYAQPLALLREHRVGRREPLRLAARRLLVAVGHVRLALGGGPAQLGDQQGLAPVAVRGHHLAVALEDRPDAADLCGEGVEGRDVELAAAARIVDLREVLPALVREPGEHHLGVRVSGLDGLARPFEQLHVVGCPRVVRPERLEVRLVPDLPVVDRQLRHARVLAPERAVRAVAAHEVGRVTGVGGEVARRRVEVAGRARGPVGRGDQHGQNAHPASRRR